MSEPTSRKKLPDFGQPADERLQGLATGADVGRMRAKVLCSHPDEEDPRRSRRYSVAQVRGEVVICGGNHYQLRTGTYGPPFGCPGCPGRRRYLDLQAIRQRLFTPHNGVLVLEADEVSTADDDDADLMS